MMIDPAALLRGGGFALILLFFVAAAVLALCVRQRRRGLTAACLLLMAVIWLSLQCVDMALWNDTKTTAGRAASDWFAALPSAVLIGLPLALLAGIILLAVSARRYERAHITPMSVKAAVDTLPTGVCVDLPDGRVILVNEAMERFARAATGSLPVNGRALRETLFHGQLIAGCERLGTENQPVIALPDSTAWTISEEELVYQDQKAHRLLAAEVTEEFQKTRHLQELQAELTLAGEQMMRVNQEIVTTTAEKERLAARIRLHDQMGEDLLRMKRYLQEGGTAADRDSLTAMLRRNVTFLKTDREEPVKDTFALMLETAAVLGVQVYITGAMPEADPQQGILVTAIHECLTNTLRHAHGHTLYVTITAGEPLTALLTNDGDPPTEPIREKGGLAALRRLVENVGGEMRVCSEPRFSLLITLNSKR